MPHRTILLRTLAIILFLIGVTGSYILSVFVFDRSYMMTQHALGAPGAELTLWLMFTATILFAVIGTLLFILSFRQKRGQQTNISDSLN